MNKDKVLRYILDQNGGTLPVRRTRMHQHFKHTTGYLETYNEMLRTGALLERGDGSKGNPALVGMPEVFGAAPHLPKPELAPFLYDIPREAFRLFAERVLSQNGDPASELERILSQTNVL